ncbi:MAG: OmpP1/FadL family transporter [Planctomycetota bacterium]
MLRLAPALCLVLLLAWPACAANGPILSTVGPKGPVSLPADGDAWSMFRMPSGIGWSYGSEVDLDLFVFYSTTTMRNSLNDLRSSGSTAGANGGVIFAPGRLGDDASDEEWDAYTPAGKITLGFGIFVDMAGGTGATTKIRWQTFPETLGSRAGLQFVNATIAAAFTPTRWLSLGLGLHAVLSDVSIRTLTGGNSTPLNGSPQINGVPLPGNPTYSDFLDLFSNDTAAADPTTYFSSDLRTVMYGATFSLSLRPLENLAIGLSYRPRSWAPDDFTGDGVVNAERTFSQATAGLDPTLRQLFLATLPNGGNNGFQSRYDVTLSGLYVPRQVRFDVAFWPKEWLLIAAEVAWIEWHRAFRSFKVVLDQGNNADLNFVTGSNRIVSKLAQRWFNRFTYSLYCAVGVNEHLTLRAGMNLSKVAVNVDVANNSPNAAYVDLNLSFGATVSYSRFSFHGLLEFSPYNAQQSNARPESRTGKFTTYSARQFFFHFGATVRF